MISPAQWSPFIMSRSTRRQAACHGHQKDLGQPIGHQLPPLRLEPLHGQDVWMMIDDEMCIHNVYIGGIDITIFLLYVYTCVCV